MNLSDFRHTLHSNAELSGCEFITSQFILDFLITLNPDNIIKVAGNGIIAVFDSGIKGDSVLLRADIDGLPIAERNTFFYKSKVNGVSHKCGHDGHTTILLGLADYVSKHRPLTGILFLLFQPAEETGAGAANVINDPLFNFVKPDYAFALHNLPGFPVNSIVVRKNTFAAASKGIKIELKGLSSHASEPEKGISPVSALARLMHELPLLANPNPESEDYSLITIVHINTGNPAFGCSPENGVLMLTLRAWTDLRMSKISCQITEKVKSISTLHNLNYSITYHEKFPALINDLNTVKIIENAAKNLSLEVIEPVIPFKWSEDFAHFTSLTKCAYFGIGAGINHAPLHNPDYDFEDDIIDTAVEMWKQIYNSTLGESTIH